MVFTNLFTEEARIVTGIDVGASAIKMVTLRRNEEGRPEIMQVSSYPFGVDCINLEDPACRSRLVEVLRKAREAHGVPLGQVAIGLSRERAVVRYLTLPSTQPHEIQEMLMFDIERHIPFSVDNLQLSHTLIEQEGDSSLVMLVAAQQAEVEQLVQLFAEADIQVEVVDVDILATCASYQYDRQDTTPVRAILDLGRTRSSLGVLVNDKVRFSRSLSLGEIRLRDYAGVDETVEQIQQAHPKWLSELSTDLQRLLKAYECEPNAHEITEVVVCGGLSALPRLEHHLATQLGRRVRISPPELEGVAGVNGAMNPQMTVALGLAMRSLDQPEINLLPTPVIESRRTARQKHFLRNLGICAGLLILLASGIVAVKFQAKLAHRARLRAALAEIEPKISDIRRKRAELAEIQRNVDAANSFYRTLQDLYVRTPENVMYLNLKFEKKKHLEIRGRTGTDEEIFNLVNILKESPHFQDVILVNTRWANMYRLAVREFDLTCILKTNEEYRRPVRRRTG